MLRQMQESAEVVAYRQYPRNSMIIFATQSGIPNPTQLLNPLLQLSQVSPIIL